LSEVKKESAMLHLSTSAQVAPSPAIFARGAVVTALDSACASCAIRGTGICATLPKQERAALEHISHHIKLPKKAVLMEEDARSDFVFNIVSGTVLMFRLLANGRRQVVGLAVAGDFIGHGPGERDGVTAIAMGPVEACRYPRAAFIDLVDHSPDLLRRLHESVGRELGLAQDHMMLLGRCSAEQKLAGFFIGLRDRRARVTGLSPRIDLPMTREDIADFLGLTLETVSRTISKFARQGLIAIIPDGVRVLDKAKLETLVEA
jgi:CRP/FNR family transcriptional regulator